MDMQLFIIITMVMLFCGTIFVGILVFTYKLILKFTGHTKKKSISTNPDITYQNKDLISKDSHKSIISNSISTILTVFANIIAKSIEILIKK